MTPSKPNEAWQPIIALCVADPDAIPHESASSFLKIAKDYADGERRRILMRTWRRIRPGFKSLPDIEAR